MGHRRLPRRRNHQRYGARPNKRREEPTPGERCCLSRSIWVVLGARRKAEELLRDAEQHTGNYAFAFSDQHATYFTESFKAAKQNVVDRFEHGYLSYMLRSTHGNIAQAATLAKKNRRSFWELMRKHKIDAEQFRPEL